MFSLNILLFCPFVPPLVICFQSFHLFPVSSSVVSLFPVSVHLQSPSFNETEEGKVTLCRNVILGGSPEGWVWGPMQGRCRLFVGYYSKTWLATLELVPKLGKTPDSVAEQFPIVSFSFESWKFPTMILHSTWHGVA